MSDLETLAREWLATWNYHGIVSLDRVVALLRTRDERALRIVNEVERLKSALDFAGGAARTAEAKIEAALDAAEDTNTPDDYRKLQRVVKALRGEGGDHGRA